MVSRGVDSRPMKISSPVYGFCLLPLFSFKSHKNSSYDKAPYIASFSSPQSSLPGYSSAPKAKLSSHASIDTPTNTI